MKFSGSTLLVAVLATFLVLAPSSAWAEPVPPAPPSGQSLYGIDWAAKQIALINTTNASLTLGSASVADQIVDTNPRDYPEGAGFDAATGSVWVVSTQCKLYTVAPDDSLKFERDISEVNREDYPGFHHCLSFAPRGDGTAYLSARIVEDHGTAKVWVVDLVTGVVSSPMDISYPSGALPWTPDPQRTAGDNASDLEPNDFALNPSDGSLWAVGYWGYLYRLVLVEDADGGFWTPQDFWVSDPTNDQIVPVSITFDSNGVLWSSFYNWTDDTRNYLYALSKDDQEIWSAAQIGAFSFESFETTVDVLWFETTVTSEREVMTRELAATGSSSLLGWSASGSTLIVGIVALAATMTRNRSRRSVLRGAQ